MAALTLFVRECQGSRRQSLRAIALFLLSMVTSCATAAAEPSSDAACDPASTLSCSPTIDAGPSPPATAGSSEAQDSSRPRLLMFWGEGCRHCEEARPFVVALAASEPSIVVEFVEVRRDPVGRARFLDTTRRLRLEGAGIPMFVVGDRAIVGFRAGTTEDEVRALVRDAVTGHVAEAPRVVKLPIFGDVDPAKLSLPLFTVLIGLADGINPCAFYVLIAMLGILLRVRSRRRIALFGGVFVVMSGVVYFLFMTAWLGIFLFVGVSRWITAGLGVVLLAMGLLNLKELVWFKKGVSLMVPDKAKPGLFRRMRKIADSASLPAAIVGISVLAFVVNLVELGCTLGLPAVYTHILSVRSDLSTLARHAYLVLYNVMYVVPLAAIVVLYSVTMHRLSLTEHRAKILKGVSGALLVVFGAIFLGAPGLLR